MLKKVLDDFSGLHRKKTVKIICIINNVTIFLELVGSPRIYQEVVEALKGVLR